MKVRTGLSGAVLAGLMSMAPPAAAAAAECAGKPSAHRLTVEVTGLRAAQGQVAVTLYPDDGRRFLAPKGKLARQRVVARSPVTQACFWLPQPGVYALAVYHDANADQDFNRSRTNGMPIEGFGFSNDAPTKIGLPEFAKVRFRARAGESSVRIVLRYLR